MDLTSMMSVKTDTPVAPAIVADTSTNFDARFALFPPLPDSLNYLPVAKAVYSEDMNNVMTENKNHVQLWNPKVNQPIQIVGNKYTFHNFNDLYSRYVRCIVNSDLNLKDMRVKFKPNWNASSVEIWVSLPAHNFEKYLGEKSYMLIRLRDSHNQSSVRSVTAEIVRSFCYNGCVWGVGRGTYIQEKHTRKADPLNLADSASKFPSILANHAEVMASMRDVHVSKDESFDFFKNTIASRIVNGKPKVNEREIERCEHRWARYPQDGETLWRTYNVLTDYSSHFTTNASDEVRKAEDRRTEVRSALNTSWFRSKLCKSEADEVEVLS